MDLGANVTLTGGVALQTQESWCEFISKDLQSISFGGNAAELYFEEDKFDDVLAEMPAVRRDLGYPPLVTPTSQITGSAAALNVLFGRYKMITNEVRDIVRGKYGRVPGEISEDFRKLCIGDEPVIDHRPADDLEPELDKAKAELAEAGYPDASPEDVLSYALFPEVALPFFAKRDEQGKAAQESAVTE